MPRVPRSAIMCCICWLKSSGRDSGHVRGTKYVPRFTAYMLEVQYMPPLLWSSNKETRIISGERALKKRRGGSPFAFTPA